MIFGKSKKNESEDKNTSPEFSEPPAEEDGRRPEAEATDGYFRRLKDRLSKTRKTFSDGFDRIFAGKQRIDEDLLEELEELLITSDIGVQTALTLMEKVTSSKIVEVDQVKSFLKDEILAILEPQTAEPEMAWPAPRVIMIVGVNGTGKTTTIGKLAARATASGEKVLIGAADTFRAAAIEQLMIWAERANADIVKHKEMADPAAVAFDAVEAAKARSADLVLIDTAGRLHTKVNLMEELKKIKEDAKKHAEEAGHKLNDNEKVVDGIVAGLLKNKQKHGEIYCPCRVVTGDKEKDKAIICPCVYSEEELEQKGICLCELFVK